MRTVVVVAFAAIVVGGHPVRAQAYLRDRADSLARLDPEKEARAAVARGDLGFVLVCGYVCAPIGITDSLATIPDLRAILARSHPIEGTSDVIANQDVARLNQAAGEYALRYNPIVLAAIRKADATRRPPNEEL